MEKELRKLTRAARRRVLVAIQALRHEPRPRGAEKLEGFGDIYRIRVSDYRILYQVQDKVLTVLIIKVGHRRDVYRKY